MWHRASGQKVKVVVHLQADDAHEEQRLLRQAEGGVGFIAFKAMEDQPKWQM